MSELASDVAEGRVELPPQPNTPNNDTRVHRYAQGMQDILCVSQRLRKQRGSLRRATSFYFDGALGWRTLRP
jgi:hypothetical protein